MGAQPHWNGGRLVGLCRAARAEGDRAGSDRANSDARAGRDGRRGFVNARRCYVIGDLFKPRTGYRVVSVFGGDLIHSS